MAPPVPRSRRASTVDLTADDDGEERPQQLEAEQLYRQQAKQRPGRIQAPILIDDSEEDDEEELSDEARRELQEEMPFVDLTGEPDEQVDIPEVFTPTPLVAVGEAELNEYTRCDGLTLRKGMFVELVQPIGRFDAYFFKITAIVETESGVLLRGYHYTRTRNLSGLLRRLANELVLVANVLRTDKRDWNRQSMIDIAPDAVLCTRALITTNEKYPELNDAGAYWNTKGRDWCETRLDLVCRWQYILVGKSAKNMGQTHSEWLLRRITQDDADKCYAIDDSANLCAWRGGFGKVPGGDRNPDGRLYTPVIDLDLDDDSDAGLNTRSYSGGDAFCGAGGASRGMQQAGIKLVFSIDNWDVSNKTYAQNFPSVRRHEKDVFDFYIDNTIGADHRVDILHLSPPCQVFSPAHTRAGKNDEMNEAALFACGHVVDKVKPRIFTIEQTFGLLRERFMPQFNTLIGAFTANDYSVRWKVVHLRNWGLCQNRRRLIIIGVAPGEHLPSFPRDTHGGSRPFTTLRDAVGTNLIPGQDQHNLSDVEARPKAKNPYNPDTKAMNVITCSGGHSYHWSGKRDLTIREYANIQGFPREHGFVGAHTVCKKQIGNAVPPTMAKRLFKHLVRWLRIQDGMAAVDGWAVDLARTREAVERICFRAGVACEDDAMVIDDSDDDELSPGSSHTNAIALDGDDDAVFNPGPAGIPDNPFQRRAPSVKREGNDTITTADSDDESDDDRTLGRSPSPMGAYPVAPAISREVTMIDDDAQSDSFTIMADDDDMDVDPPRQDGFHPRDRLASVEFVSARSLN